MTTHADGPQLRTQPGGYAPATPPAAPTLPAAPPTPPSRTAAAGRRTSRRGLIISVLVVLVGGLTAFAGAQELTQHTKVLAVAQNVAVGATITSADLTVASVTKDANLSPVPASEKSNVVGAIAQVGLVKGSLLTRAEFGPSSGFTAGQMLVALPLKDGQFPARGLVAGQKVLIVGTPGANGTSPRGASGAATPGVDATVAEVGAVNAATQVTVIDVRVNASDGVTVAQLASTGNLAVILLPASR